MKKSMFVLAVSTFITAAFLISCNTPSEKVSDAQKNVTEANKELDKANAEYLAEVEKYRKEAADKIAANEKSIAEFKARIELDKNAAKADYRMKIAKLEQKNSDVKKKMDDYKAEGKDQWDAFKTEFSKDLDELGKAFRDLTVDSSN